MHIKNKKKANDCDVLIIGAGPAGAIAAHKLVKDGYRVIVVEQKKLPRYKICSGLIMDRSQDLIEEYFGAPPLNVFCSPNYLKGSRICLEGDTFENVPAGKSQTYNVWRSEFDHWLIKSSGAKVLDSNQLLDFKQEKDTVRALILGPDKETFSIEASYLIGADGGRSRVRGLLYPDLIKQISRFVFMQAYCIGTTKLEREYYYMFFDPSLSALYTWLNFKDDYIVYGVGAHSGGSLKPYFKESSEYLAKHFDLKIDTIVRKTGCTATDMGIKNNFRLGRERVLLVGEAAGFMNLFGEGISSALTTGKIAAKAIQEAESSEKDVLPIYSELSSSEREYTSKSWELADMILGRDFLGKGIK